LRKIKGKGEDKWGKFRIDGAVGCAGQQPQPGHAAFGPIRAAYMKQYSSGTYVKYTGLMSGDTFRGEWKVIDDPEHGTFELRFTSLEPPAANAAAEVMAAFAELPMGVANDAVAAGPGDDGLAHYAIELAELRDRAADALPVEGQRREGAGEGESPSVSVVHNVPGGPGSENCV